MRICQYCGVERPDDPVLECWVDNEQTSCIAAVRMTGERWITRPYPPAAKFLAKPRQVTAAIAAAAATFT